MKKNKTLGILYMTLGLTLILLIAALGYKIILGVIGIVVGILLINMGLKLQGMPTMQQRVKQKVMQKINPFNF